MDQRNDDNNRYQRYLAGEYAGSERGTGGGWIPSDPDYDRHWMAEHHYGERGGREDENAIERFGHKVGEGLERAGRKIGRFVGLGPKGWTRSDERIKEDICERLTAHGDIDASDIEVEVKDGEVTLGGTVTDRRTKRMAEDEADHVSGVKDVHNRIKLRAGELESGTGRQGSEKDLH